MKRGDIVAGRYELCEELASGGMGTVWLARQRGAAGFARFVAIKKMHAHLARDATFAAMFVDEARIAARIHHPSVVPLLDVVASGSELALVMPFVEGPSLAQVVDAGRVIPVRVALRLIHDVCLGLAAAHGATDGDGKLLHVVHRDVSAQNVLVGTDGLAHLIDFGIAKGDGRVQGDTAEGRVKGKLAYLPPEQLLGGKVDEQSDVYATGVCLWEAIAGRNAHQGDETQLMKRAVSVDLGPPSAERDGVPREVDAIVARATRKTAGDRYPSARAMAEDLALVPGGLAERDEIVAWLEEAQAETLARGRARRRAIETGPIGDDAVAASLTHRSVAAPALRALPRNAHDDTLPASAAARSKARPLAVVDSRPVSGDPDPLCGIIVDGRYRIDHVIGSGGFGVVYAAFHIGLGGRVAIKVPRIDGRTPEIASETIATFLEEGRTLKRLRHPSLVAALDVGLLPADAQGIALPYLVLEWCDGPNLRDWLERRAAPLDKAEAWSLLRPVIEAIAHAHAAGIAHRDVKPANILLEEKDGGIVPRVIDFGVAKVLGLEERAVPAATQTTSPRRAFTLQYAAPEQLTGLRTGPWTDVYALALVLIELVRGKPVFPREGPGQSILDADLPTPSSLGLTLGPWNDVLARALSLKPADRHADARALLRALDADVTAPSQPPVAIASTHGAPPAPDATLRAAGAVAAGRGLASLDSATAAVGVESAPRPSSPRGKSHPARWIGVAVAVVGAGTWFVATGNHDAAPPAPTTTTTGARAPAAATDENTPLPTASHAVVMAQASATTTATASGSAGATVSGAVAASSRATRPGTAIVVRPAPEPPKTATPAVSSREPLF